MKYVTAFLLVLLISSCQKAAETTDNEEVAESTIVSDSTQTFEWTYGMCQYTGTFLPSEISKEALEHTSQLCFSGVKLEGDPTVFIPKLKEMSYQDHEILAFLKELKAEFEEKELLLKRDVVETDYWKNLRAIRLKELREEYALKRSLMEGYSNPKALLSGSFSENCNSYVRPLASKDSTEIIRVWKQLMDKQKAENGNPSDIESRFSQQQNSPQKWEFARETILIYGWYNCVNDQRTQWQNDDEVQAGFARLFVKIDQICDN